MDNKQPTVPEIIMMAGGGVNLIFSFLSFYEVSFAGHSSGTSAWGTGLFPVATIIPFFGVLVALSIVLTKFANVKLPEPLIGFTIKQIRLVLSFFAAFLMLCFLVQDKPGTGIGFWFLFLGSAALLTGAIMETVGFNPQAAKPAAPGGYPQGGYQQGGYPQGGYPPAGQPPMPPQAPPQPPYGGPGAPPPPPPPPSR